MHNLILSSFFSTKWIKAPQDNTLGLKKPYSNSSYKWILSSLSSSGAILYGALEIGVVLGTKSMVNSTALVSGSLRTSYGNMSTNSLQSKLDLSLVVY